jgi:hypothetical protein
MKYFIKTLKILGGILLFLVILNFALEPVALYYANKSLSELKGYEGSIKDIDIHLYRGAYKIDTLVIRKKSKGKAEPFFAVDNVDISIEWKSLFKGAVVAEFVVEHPVINFVKYGNEVDTGGDNNFLETIKGLSPIDINRVQINNGEMHYIDHAAKPQIDVTAKNIKALALNLRNVDNKNEKLPSTITATANTSGNGTVSAKAKMNVLKDTPDFDFNFQLDKMDLTYLKDFTDAYASFTFKRGQLFLSTELAMADGNYVGYLKPAFENIKIFDLTPDTEQEKKRPFLKKVWEFFVGTTVSLVKNHAKDRLATRIPLKGTVNSSESFTWTTIINVLKNGFIKAFDKDVEGSINFNDAIENKVEITKKK